ncbi:MAG: hypothetical protein WD850_02310, partial [Candidatus Spechtbacterales bacterium]
FDEFQERFNKVRPYTKWVQLDVADGKFAPNTSWGDPEVLSSFDRGGVNIEAHLMLEHPEEVLDAWCASGVQRIYLHHEAMHQPATAFGGAPQNAVAGALRKIHNAGIEAGVAVLPQTPLSALEPYLEKVDAVQLFNGNLGFYSEEEPEEVGEALLERIRTLRASSPDVIIEIDGGMNPENARRVVQAGANWIVSGSYIWESEDIEEAIEELVNSTKR